MDVCVCPGTARNSLNQPNIWLTILLTSILCVLPVVTYRFVLIQLCPTINEKVQAELYTYHLTLRACLFSEDIIVSNVQCI